MLENPQNLTNHNTIRNDKCEGLKIVKIGQSAGKELKKKNIKVPAPTTIPGVGVGSSDPKQATLQKKNY